MARAERIEKVVDRLAATMLAGAAAVTALKFLPGGLLPWAFATGAGLISYVLCTQALGRIRPEDPKFELAEFEPAHIEAAPELDELLLTEQVELILTDADRLRSPSAADELLLVDVLNEIGPEARVVRLFDPASIPTPGELNARVRRDLDGESPSAAPTDASQALYDALTELKRSLR